MDLLLVSALVPLHAGFAFVATVSEGLINDELAGAVAKLPPVTASLPNMVQLGTQAVFLNGALVVLPPSVTLKARADNLVTAHVAFAGVVTVGVGAPATTFELVLKADLDIGLITQITGQQQIAVGVDLTQATVDSASIFSISGGLPVGGVQAALQDPTVLAQLTGALRALGQVTATPGVLKSAFNLTQTYQPYKGSIFFPRKLFDINIDISRIVVKPLDGALAVATDLAGLSAGDPNAIVDLRTAWVPSETVRTVKQIGGSSLGGGNSGPRDSDFAVTANAGVITQIVGIVSGQISGKFPVDDHIQMNALSAAFAPVHPQLSTISVPGIVITANLTYWVNTTRDGDGYVQAAGADSMEGTATISTDLEHVTFDGDTAWLSRQPADYYTTRVLDFKIDPSGLLAVLVTYAGLFVSLITYGALAPMAIISVVALLDGIIPGVLANVESQVTRTLQAGLTAGEDSIGVTASRTDGITVENLLDADGIYTFGNVDVPTAAASLQVIPGTFETTRVNNDPSPEPAPGWHLSVYDRTPVTCRLTVPAQVANPQDPTWRIAWTVTRTDTNGMFVNTDQRASAPGTLQIQIDHASAELKPVDSFMVTCRLYRNLGFTVQEAFFSRFNIDIDDYLDRHHPYVQWGTLVYWQAEGKPPGTYWTRQRHSRIHRTAVPGRCEVMRTQPWAFRTRKSKADPKILLPTAHSRSFVYLDGLPFPLSELNAHRHGVLCDYCFFGGPTRTKPLVDVSEIVPDPGVYQGG